MKRHDYYAPESVGEASQILHDHGPGGRLIAGGTDIVVGMNQKGAYPEYIVSTRKLTDELAGIKVRDAGGRTAGVTIGGGTTMRDIEHHEVCRRRLAAIWDGARVVGSVQTRNMATIAGNLATASPSADTTPGVIALGSTIQASSWDGERTIKADDFFQDVRKTALRHDEVLKSIDIDPIPERSGSAYQRHTPRKWMDLAFVGVAAYVELDEKFETIKDARVVLGAVAPTPVRSPHAEKVLIGNTITPELLERAGQESKRDCSPITDVRASAEYRTYLIGVWTKRVIQLAIDNARTDSSWRINR